MVLGAGMQRLGAVAGLCHHFDAGLAGQQRAQALAGKRLVVGDDDLHPIPLHASPAGAGALPSGTRSSTR